MTKDEALKLALEALEAHADIGIKSDKAITAIKEALAQPAQEPVAWITPDGEGFRIRFSAPTSDVPLGWDALYTIPQQRPWVGLTDDEIDKIFEEVAGPNKGTKQRFARAIEATLKEKNT
jgi:hypothetical protein